MHVEGPKQSFCSDEVENVVTLQEAESRADNILRFKDFEVLLGNISKYLDHLMYTHTKREHSFFPSAF